MTYKEIKDRIVDLGFEDDEITIEYSRIIANAVNDAIDHINSTVRPYVKSVTVETPCVFDMRSVEDFVDFHEKPYFTENEQRKILSKYFIENLTTIVVEEEIGDITVYYTAAPTRITEDTEDSFEIELDRIVHPLIPLLASYFVWLDDDERKAADYFNQYVMKREEILAKNPSPITVNFFGGVAWRR